MDDSIDCNQPVEVSSIFLPLFDRRLGCCIGEYSILCAGTGAFSIAAILIALAGLKAVNAGSISGWLPKKDACVAFENSRNIKETFNDLPLSISFNSL